MREAPFAASEFAARVAAFPWRRLVTEVHVHHTWRPRRADWKGQRTIDGMERAHLDRGFIEIAQHLTIDPAGLLWVGRSWNVPPASSPGHNGNSRKGPFMFEMIGDFDEERDVLDGAQRAAAVRICRVLCARFLLNPDAAVRFHRDLGSPKTCPGSSVAWEDFVAEVAGGLDVPLPPA